MQLKNNLYQILKSEGEKPNQSFFLSLNPSCFIYQAHFPGEPITPGVCIVQMGVELVEEMLQKKMELTKVKNVKFLSVLTPQDNQNVTFAISKFSEEEKTNEVKVQLVVSANGEAKAKLSLVLRSR